MELTHSTINDDPMKQCSRCKGCKPLSAFVVDPHRKDGHRGTCLVCYALMSRNWREKNPEKARASRQKFLATHKEQLRTYETQRWSTHRETMAERNRRWRQSHPLQRAENEARRRAKLKGCDTDKVDYAAILERDGWNCYLCDEHVTHETLSFDHVVPIKQGGLHTADNIKVTHRSCNSRKGAKALNFQMQTSIAFHAQ